MLRDGNYLIFDACQYGHVIAMREIKFISLVMGMASLRVLPS